MNMNCIHFFLERKVDGKWEAIPRSVPKLEAEDEETKALVEEIIQNETLRPKYNQILIKSDLLAGFLSGHKDKSITPLSPAKGFPEDVTSIVKEKFEAVEHDVHMPSHLLVSELLEAKDKSSTINSWMDADDFLLFKMSKDGQDNQAFEWFDYKPNYYQELTNKQMERIAKIPLFTDERARITNVVWQMPNNSRRFNTFWNFIDEIKVLDENPENLRLVFWVDD